MAKNERRGIAVHREAIQLSTIQASYYESQLDGKFGGCHYEFVPDAVARTVLDLSRFEPHEQ